MATAASDGLPIEVFASPEDFETWLEAHAADAKGVWLKIAKKAAGVPSVTYSEALDVALCHGWIDGHKRPLDDRWWLQRFTPRGPRSRWSRINRTRVEALIAAGRMRPGGTRQVDLARSDGRWDAAYEGQRTAVVPADLQRALDANPRALAFFATLDRVNRYAVVYRIGVPRTPEGRARAIARFVAKLEAHEKVHG